MTIKLENLDWGAIGAVVAIIVGLITAIGVFFTILQYFKKDKDTVDNSINQNISGIFFIKNKIIQKIKDKRGDDN